MKKTILVVCLITGLLAASAFAQMSGHGEMTGSSGHGHEMSSSHKHMMSGHMTEQDMINDMAGMISQMNQMLMKITHKMPDSAGTEQAKIKEMGSVMHEMAAVMQEIAASMDQGKMEKQTVDKMHERIKSLQQKME